MANLPSNLESLCAAVKEWDSLANAREAMVRESITFAKVLTRRGNTMDQIIKAARALVSSDSSTSETEFEGYPGIAHDFETMRAAVEKIAIARTLDEAQKLAREACKGSSGETRVNSEQPISTAPKNGIFLVCLEACPDLWWPAFRTDGGPIYSNAHGKLNEPYLGRTTVALYWRPMPPRPGSPEETTPQPGPVACPTCSAFVKAHGGPSQVFHGDGPCPPYFSENGKGEGT